MNRRSTLAGIMSAWNGEQLQIKVQGLRTVVRSPQQKKHYQNIHNYRTVQDRSQKNHHPIPSNYQTMKQNMHGDSKFYNQQFTVRARSKSPNERISLADMGDLYSQNQSRNESRKSNVKRRESHGNENKGRVECFQNIGCGYNFSKVKRKDLIQRNQSVRQIGWVANRQNELKQIMQSINQIKLPSSQNFCPMYNQANIKFQQMKSEILHKIITSGQQNQMQDIIKQIKMAADRIIAKHCSTPRSQKQNDEQLKDHPEVKQKQVISLNEIEQEQQDRSLYINLPQFKDDAGSISSIMSKDDIRKDQSKEEDVAKIQNIFIHDGTANILGSFTSKDNQLPIVIQGLKPTINEQSIGQNKQSAKSSLLPKQIGHFRQEIKVEMPKANTLHFVRKEQVVKCLMAAHVVDKQSASIEF